MGGDGSGTWLDDDATEAGAPDREQVQGSPSRYDIAAEVARGGLGRISRAQDTWLDREVAIKTLLVHSPGAEARFDREMRLTARLQHPNIVPVFDGGRLPGDHPYMAMRLVHGRPLSEAISAADGLDGRLKLLPHVVDACNAVAYAHDQRVLHRDLKPDNVLVGAFGETVVIDWGLAKDMDDDSTDEVGLPAQRSGSGSGSRSGTRSLTVVGSVMGTPAYMPPEQAQGQAIDARADVYALGAMLYELLAGERPYAGADDVLVAVRTGPPVALSVRVPEAPQDLVGVVERAMARDLSHRYPDATALAADLARFQEGRLVEAYHYSPRERLVRWVRQRPVVAGLLLAMGVGALASVALLEHSRSQAEGARAVAEQERAVAQALQAEAVRGEDTQRVERARALAERDPNEAVRLLGGLSAGHPFDGTVRTIFSAAMHAGLRRAVPGVSREMGGVAASGDWLAVVQRDGLLLTGNDLTERARVPFEQDELDGVIAVGDGGRFLAVTADALVMVDKGQVTERTAADLYKLSLGPSASQVLVSRVGDPIRVDADGRLTPLTGLGPVATAGAEGEDSVVVHHDGSVTWIRSGVSVHQDGPLCPMPVWTVALNQGRAFVVGAFGGVCVLERSGTRVSGRVVPLDGREWADLVLAAADGVWIGGSSKEISFLDGTEVWRERIVLAGLPEGIARRGDEVVVVSDAGDVVRRGPSGRLEHSALPGAAQSAVIQADGSTAVSSGSQVLRMPRVGMELVGHSDAGNFYVRGDGSVSVPEDPSWERRCGPIVWSAEGGRVLRDGVQVFAFDSLVRGFECNERGDVAVLADDGVALFDADGQLVTQRVEAQGSVAGVGLSGNGMLLATSHDGVTTWRWHDGVWSDHVLHHPVALTETRDGDILYVSLGRELVAIVAGTRERLDWRVAAMARGGDLIAMGGVQGELEVRRGDERFTVTKGHAQYITALDFDPERRFLVSGAYDHTVRLWDLSVSPIVSRAFPGHAYRVVAARWGSPGVFYSMDGDGDIFRWTDPWPTDPVALRQAVHAVVVALDTGGPLPEPAAFAPDSHPAP